MKVDFDKLFGRIKAGTKIAKTISQAKKEGYHRFLIDSGKNHLTIEVRDINDKVVRTESVQ